MRSRLVTSEPKELSFSRGRWNSFYQGDRCKVNGDLQVGGGRQARGASSW